MIAQTPLQQALVAWQRDLSRCDENEERQTRIDDAITLGETGVFSNRNIALITGLEPDFVGGITGKKDKTGGRFNPEMLPQIYDLRMQWVQARVVAHKDVAFIVSAGVSPGMLAKLTGISRTAIYSWVQKEES